MSALLEKREMRDMGEVNLIATERLVGVRTDGEMLVISLPIGENLVPMPGTMAEDQRTPANYSLRGGVL